MGRTPQENLTSRRDSHNVGRLSAALVTSRSAVDHGRVSRASVLGGQPLPHRKQLVTSTPAMKALRPSFLARLRIGRYSDQKVLNRASRGSGRGSGFASGSTNENESYHRHARRLPVRKGVLFSALHFRFPLMWCSYSSSDVNHLLRFQGKHLLRSGLAALHAPGPAGR